MYVAKRGRPDEGPARLWRRLSRREIVLASILVLIVTSMMFLVPSIGGCRSIFVTLEVEVLDRRDESPVPGVEVVAWDIPQIGGGSWEPIGGPWTSATTDSTGKASLLFRMGAWRADGTFWDTYHVPDSEATIRASATDYDETSVMLREYLTPGRTSRHQEIAASGIMFLEPKKTRGSTDAATPSEDETREGE